MPEISRFFGILIAMYYSDHPPPHFHARYGEHEAIIAIETGEVLAGRLPPRALGLVEEWRASHRQELTRTGGAPSSGTPWNPLRHWSEREEVTGMIPRVEEAVYRRGYVVWVRFVDGAAGEIDLADQLKGRVFEPLKDPDAFRQFVVDPELGTLVWPNGADLAPEFLYQQLHPEYRLGSSSRSGAA